MGRHKILMKFYSELRRMRPRKQKREEECTGEGRKKRRSVKKVITKV